MVDLNRAVKNYYGQTQLSDEQFEKLFVMEAVSGNSLIEKEGASVTRNISPKLGFLSLAASLLIAVILVFILSVDNVSERVAREVAMNHNKALEVEYQTDSFEVLSQYMNKLDFSLQVPSDKAFKNFTLVGGRYCSIQGQLAAQIKLADNSGQVYTLYQTRSGEHLESISVGRMQLDQVDIRLWEEQGFLFALAAMAE